MLSAAQENTHLSVGSKQNVYFSLLIQERWRKVRVRYLCVVGFSLFSLSVAGEVVQSAVLHEGCEGEDEADRDEQVHGSDVGNFGQGLPGDGAEGCHGQHCGDA